MTAPIRQPVRLPTSARGQFPCATARSKTGRSCPRSLLASLRQTEHGFDVIPDLPPGVQRSSSSCQPNHRGHVAVVSLRGELDFLGASVLQAYLSGIRWQAWARSVADLTGLAFIDYASLSVLVRHCKEIRDQGGSFALAGPQPAVLRSLSVTGLLTWFEVHDTVEEAVAGTDTRRSSVLRAAPVRPRPRSRRCSASPDRRESSAGRPWRLMIMLSGAYQYALPPAWHGTPAGGPPVQAESR